MKNTPEKYFITTKYINDQTAHNFVIMAKCAMQQVANESNDATLQEYVRKANKRIEKMKHYSNNH